MGECEACITPIEIAVRSKLLNRTKNRTSGHILSNIAFVYATCTVCVTMAINSTWIQILRSYMLLFKPAALMHFWTTR